MRASLRFMLAAALMIFGLGRISPARAQDFAATHSGWTVDTQTAVSAVSPKADSAKKPVVVLSGPQFAGVRGLAVDASGQLYVSLSANPPAAKCVSRLTPGAHLAFSQPILIFSNCDSVASEDPSGIAVTLEGRIFLANLAQNTVRMLDMRTGGVQILPGGSKTRDVAAGASSNLDPYRPAGLTVDSRHNLFIADRGNNRILALSPGAETFSFLAHVLDVTSLASNAQGSILYAASPASHQIFRVDAAAGMAAPFAGNGGTEPSASENLSASEPALEVTISSPAGVAVDGAGNVFITDAAANALFRVDAQSGMLFVAVQATLDSPGALAIDRKGDVFVADRGNQRILEFAGLASPAVSGGVTLSPASLDFGTQPTGGTTATQTLTLANNSGTALAFTTNSLSFSGTDPNDFTQTNNCAPQVAAGGSCQINVAFAPQGTASRSATIQVTDADSSSPQTAQLSGTGDDFELPGTVTETTANVVPGNTATYTLTIQPDNIFSGTVAIQCPSTLPKGANLTCSTSPASVDLTPGQSQQYNVKITTQGPNATSPVSFLAPNFPGNRPLPPAPLSLALLLALGGFALIFKRRWNRLRPIRDFAHAHWTVRRRFAAAILALASAFAAAGCYHRPRINPNETPVGVYSFNITATSQGASRSITLTLNVE